jgi:predicted ribosome quality control (RQC) complex YloA/Tae2 family protein
MITEIESIRLRAHIYELGDSFIVIAGKTSKDNDFISMKVAGKNDLWFHIKGMSGSHVLLRSKDKIKPGRIEIEKAAAVAAYYSKARNAGIVPVNYTFAHCVSKPSKAPSGTVTIKKAQVVKVRPSLP